MRLQTVLYVKYPGRRRLLSRFLWDVISTPQLRFKPIEQGVVFYFKPPATSRSPKIKMARWPKTPWLRETFIRADSLAAWVVLAWPNALARLSVTARWLGSATRWQPMVERLGRLSDLELWRDIRASNIDCARCCGCARVSQPNASGLRLVCRFFCRRLGRYKPIRPIRAL